MNSCPHNFDDLQDRLLKLEKQNRRFKQLAVVVETTETDHDCLLPC